jgi:hypothetical protein
VTQPVACPFYGLQLHHWGAWEPVLTGQGGNQCALREDSFAPCSMEIAGRQPEWNLCEFENKQARFAKVRHLKDLVDRARETGTDRGGARAYRGLPHIGRHRRCRRQGSAHARGTMSLPLPGARASTESLYRAQASPASIRAPTWRAGSLDSEARTYSTEGRIAGSGPGGRRHCRRRSWHCAPPGGLH